MGVKKATAAYRSLDQGNGERQDTDVGPLPKDWRVGRLHELATIRTGIAKNGGAEIDTPVVVHYLRVANVQDGYLDLSEMSQLRVRSEDVKRYAVLPGDMLMNEGGDLDKLGRGALWKGEFDPCVHQNHVFVVRCGDQLLPDFLSAWTGSTSARRFFMLAGRQTTNLASINKTSLGQLPVPLPRTKSEQQAIAEALSDADALIESLSLLLAKKRQIKQGAMQELLTGKKRLPGFSSSWNEVSLGSVATITMGRTPSRLRPDFWGSGTKWLSIADLRGKFVRESKEEITEAGAAEMMVIREGTLLMSFKLSIGRLAFAGCDLLTNEAICAFRQPAVNTEFLYYALQRVDFSLFGKQAVKGYTLNKESLKSVTVTIATDPEEQSAIGRVLADMDLEIDSIEDRLVKARQLKQGMMQALLTGRVRLMQAAASNCSAA